MEKTPAVPAVVQKTREQILDGGDLESPVALELDLGPAPSSRNAPTPPSEPSRVATAAAVDTRASLASVPDLDRVEVRMVARFGMVPESWLGTPGYVRHVRARQVELEKELRSADEEFLVSKTALDDGLIAVGQRALSEVRGTQKARGSYLKSLDRLAKREAELKIVDKAGFEESERQRGELQALFERIEAVKRKLEATKTKELAAELTALQQEREVVEKAVKVPSRSQDPEVEQARKVFRAACADFASFVLEDRANFGEDYEEARARVARLKLACDAAEKKVLLLQAAQTAYDASALATGVRVTYGAVGLAILSLAALAFFLR
jgi:hypothetical protein